MKLEEERRDIYPNSFLFLTVRAQLSPGFAAPSKVARQRVLVSVDPQLQRGLSSKEMTSKPSIFPFVSPDLDVSAASAVGSGLPSYSILVFSVLQFLNNQFPI